MVAIHLRNQEPLDEELFFRRAVQTYIRALPAVKHMRCRGLGKAFGAAIR